MTWCFHLWPGLGRRLLVSWAFIALVMICLFYGAPTNSVYLVFPMSYNKNETFYDSTHYSSSNRGRYWFGTSLRYRHPTPRYLPLNIDRLVGFRYAHTYAFHSSLFLRRLSSGAVFVFTIRPLLSAFKSISCSPTGRIKIPSKSGLVRFEKKTTLGVSK